MSAVGGASATLNGTVNPGGAATEWWFEYGTSTSYGSATTHTSAGSGSANVAVSRALTGLSPATTYHYRLVAKNASGTPNGGDGLFTTASPPVVVTSPATGVGPTTATLGGTVNPNGEPTTWFVEYGTSTSYGSKSATADAGSGTAAKAFSVGVSGLTAGKTYHFRLVATSSAGTVNGADATFVTAEAPVATTSAASSITVDRREAQRQGRPERPHDDLQVRVRHDDVLRHDHVLFERGQRHERDERLEDRQRAQGGHRLPLPPRRDERRRHRHGQPTRVFTTQGAPIVVTGQATAVGPTSATLGGTVNPNGRSTSWYIDYGPTASYGARTSTSSAGSGTKTVAVSKSGLEPQAEHHVPLQASSA